MREKEFVCEEICDEKLFEFFAGSSYKIGRYTRARVFFLSVDWMSGMICFKYGNVNFLK